jgi:two-component system sensor kinase
MKPADDGAYLADPGLVRSALLNILEDFNAEKLALRDLYAALMNILDDIDEERRQLARAKDALEASNRELEAFSYSVSHDLQAPLRAINGYSRALAEDYQPVLDDQGRHYLAMIERYGTKMGRLIQDLLSFSRLGRRRVTEVTVDMGELAHEAFVELNPEPAMRRVSFHVGKLPPAQGDRAMIHQVFVNLLGNALKFTKSRDEALISVTSHSSGEGAVYSVSDNGVGFDMKYSGKLFGIFERLHSENEFEGTGIGLALVARIVAYHGGRIWATSTVDEGAQFHFTLPGKA